MASENIASLKKKAKDEGYRLIDVDEASISLASSLGYTYARCGERPVIETSTEISNRMYLASGISASGELVYKVRHQPFDGQPSLSS